MLWAWIEWTPKGHQAVNEGEYVFFSTEYDYPDFEVIDNRVVAPVRLAGLSVTNYPNHRGQLPMTNSRKQANRDNQQDKDMKPTNKTRTAITKPKRDKNSELDQTPDEPTEGKTSPTPPAQEDNKPADTNSDTAPDDPEKDTNDDGSAAVNILMQLAEEMDLDESANAEDVLARRPRPQVQGGGTDRRSGCRQRIRRTGHQQPQTALPEPGLPARRQHADAGPETQPGCERAHQRNEARREHPGESHDGPTARAAWIRKNTSWGVNATPPNMPASGAMPARTTRTVCAKASGNNQHTNTRKETNHDRL